jgi:hypothetical protein
MKLNEAARLQKWADQLALESGINTPRKPQDVKIFMQELEKNRDVNYLIKTTNLSGAKDAQVIDFAPGGFRFQMKGTNLNGEEVPWGATTRSSEIIAESAHIWSIRNAVVLNWFGQFLFFDSTGRLIRDVSSRWWPVSAISQLICEVANNPTGTLGEAYASIADDSPDNFCHWVANILPRISLAPALAHILLPEIQARYQFESAELMGVANRILRLESQKAYRIDNLLVSTTSGEYLRHPAQRGATWAAQTWDDIKDRVENRLGRKRRSKYLYISRELASRRILTPASEVREVFENLGFESVQLESLSFVEQVEQFIDAEIVVGPHGAGLAGVSFMSPNSRLLEIHGHDYGTPAFKMLSAFRHVNYYSITGKNIEVNVGNRSDIEVDPVVLKKCVESLI